MKFYPSEMSNFCLKLFGLGKYSMPNKWDFKLDKKSVKGDRGVLLIIGGSEMYTGAPFFASKAAFLTGIDLVYILTCSNSKENDYSSISLKTLLPECIILPILNFDLTDHKFILDRTTTVLLGSGMGRPNEQVTAKISEVLSYIHENKSIPTIIDGDGIHFCHEKKDLKIKNKIFTPNKNEEKHIEKDEVLSKGAIILLKGPKDCILIDNDELLISGTGGYRRCGGLGDILAGVLASFLNVFKTKEKAVRKTSVFMKDMIKKASSRYRVSMVPENVLNEIKLYFADNPLEYRQPVHHVNSATQTSQTSQTNRRP